jgi:hypothetical protein
MIMGVEPEARIGMGVTEWGDVACAGSSRLTMF